VELTGNKLNSYLNVVEEDSDLTDRDIDFDDAVHNEGDDKSDGDSLDFHLGDNGTDFDHR
jgi:hypothetical protein